MKAIFLVLLVCVASTYAVQSPLSSLLTQVQSLVQSSFGQLLSQLLSAIQNRVDAKINLSAIIGTFQILLDSVSGTLVQQVTNVVLQLAQGLLTTGGSKSQQELSSLVSQKFEDIFSNLLTSLTGALTTLAQSLLGNLLVGGKRDVQGILSALGINLDSILSSLQGNLLGVVFNFLSGISSTPRDLVSSFLQLLGLDKILAQLQSVGTAVYSQFMGLITQLMFAGTQMWQQAIPVFNNLVAELTSHTGNAVQIVSQAVLQLTAVLASGPARSIERAGLLDTLMGFFNLAPVWDTITSVGTAVYSQFLSLLTQLLFAGQQMWAQATPVFSNLVAELTAHTGNAVVIVSQAIQQLTAVLASGPQRAARLNVVDFLVNALGLGQVWSMVQSVGTNLYSQLLSLMTQLMFAGQQMWAQATPVFSNLVAELTAHTGNAVQIVSQAVLQLSAVLASGPARSVRFDLITTIINTLGLGQVWTSIQSVGTNLYSQFLSLATSLLFAGQQMWAQATPVLSNLVAELTAHTGNAVVIVSQAVQQLTAVLASGPASRGVVDFLVNSLGLSQVWSLIQSVGTNLYSQLLTLMTQLMFAGQQMWQQALPVFNNLVAELTAHTGNAVVLVSQAVQQLTAVLASGPSY